MDTVIIAPHPDDEIIGCYKVLIESKPVIIYDGDTDQERREEAKKLQEHVEIKAQMFQKSLPAIFNKETIFYFPDPINEIHPLHRHWGLQGEQLARDGFNVIFYSTLMNAPYIHEVENPKDKRILLYKTYISQCDLWKYDHKYFLFEGYCKWIF